VDISLFLSLRYTGAFLKKYKVTAMEIFNASGIPFRISVFIGSQSSDSI